MSEEHAAGRQQRHASRRALEQRRPDLVLERADLATHRRLRDVQALRGTADVPFLGNGDEVADLGEAHVAIVAVVPEKINQIKTVLDEIYPHAARKDRCRSRF